jgi:hypothetical protein
MMRRAWFGIAGALAGALAGCGLAPDVGPQLTGTCDDADGNPAAQVSFSQQIRPLIVRGMGGCSCHLPTSSGAGQGTQITGLDLSSLANLRAGGHNSGAQVVVPLQPCASILYQKVDDAPPFGSRMPLNGPPYWTEEEIDLVHDWIAEGALDN